MKTPWRLGAALSAAMFLSLPAWAQETGEEPDFGGDFQSSTIDTIEPTAETRELLQAIEDYLNGIESLKARFVQVSSNGSYAEGELLVERPGKLRFEYDPPHPVLIIAKDGRLLYYDRDLEEATFVSVSDTPLWFLIREEISLVDPVRVIEMKRREGSLLLTVVDPDAVDAGTVTLQFDEDPLTLTRWQVVDPDGMITQVAIKEPQRGLDLADQNFDIDPYSRKRFGDGSSTR